MTKEAKKTTSKTTKKDTKVDPVKKLKDELKEAQNDYLRARADFDNYRKRTQDEMTQVRERAISSFVEDLLPAIDNFELSLKMTDNKDMFIKGVEMIHKNLLDTLKEHNIEEFEPKVGDKFDPALHDPIPIEDHSKDAGTVLAVIKKGFKHKDNVVRHAKVNVKKE